MFIRFDKRHYPAEGYRNVIPTVSDRHIGHIGFPVNITKKISTIYIVPR